MFIRNLKVKHFRTLTNFDISFTDHYTAICGQNNSGKSNIVKSICFLLVGDDYVYWDESTNIHYKRDRTAWIDESKKVPISIECTIDLTPDIDNGLIEFVSRFSSGGNSGTPEKIQLRVSATITSSGQPKYEVSVNGTSLEEFSSQEIVKKLRSTSSCIYHNSTTVRKFYHYRSRSRGIFNALSPERRQKLSRLQQRLTKEIEKCLDEHKQRMVSVLGRITDHLDISLNVPALDVDQLPVGISLGDKTYKSPLDEWGSGTRNMMIVLQTLIDAKMSASAKTISDQMTPIVIVEEPESFLHPSAQAKFGNVLQQLAEEMKIQLIVTSHSPYMLSHRFPESNVLVERAIDAGSRSSRRLTDTRRVETDGADWSKPFEHALGASGPEMEYLKSAIFSRGRELILVEGSTDKRYLDDLLDNRHGKNAIQLDGQIVPYNGASNLENSTWVKFVMNLYPVALIAYDLDQHKKLEPILSKIGLKPDKHFLPVGIAPINCIEACVPKKIYIKVGQDHPDLLQAMTAGGGEEAKSARAQFKKLVCQQFQETASIEDGDYDHFYSLARKVNRALQSQRTSSP